MTRLAKLLFVVANSWLCCHCRNLAGGSCLLSPFHFKLCRYFLGHVACRNLPWQGLTIVKGISHGKKSRCKFNAGLVYRGNMCSYTRIDHQGKLFYTAQHSPFRISVRKRTKQLKSFLKISPLLLSCFLI